MANTPSNHVTWFQIPADNSQRAWDFYGRVFGWSQEEVYKDEKMTGAINGAIDQRNENLQTPRLVIRVDNITSMMDTIVAAGGEIVVGRTEIPEINMVYAVFKDTEGNLINIVGDLN